MCIGLSKLAGKVMHVNICIDMKKTEYLYVNFFNKTATVTFKISVSTGILRKRILVRVKSKNHVRIMNEVSANSGGMSVSFGMRSNLWLFVKITC